MKFNRFTLVMAAFPFVLYACGSDDSGGGGGTGGKKDAGTDSGKGGTGGVGAIGGTGGAGLTGGTGGNTGGVAGVAGSAAGGAAGVAGSATGGTAGVAGSATGGTAGVAGSASGGTAGVAGSASGGTAGVGPDASVGGSAGASTGGTAGTDSGTLPTGDTCASAFVIGSLPFAASSSTVGAGSDYGYGASACLPETDAAGSAAPDHVYSFTPTTTGKYFIGLTTESGFDSALYVATDCANINTTCLVGDEDICSDCTESVTLDATAGTTYYVFVDGYQNAGTPTGGAYTLTVDPVAAPTNDTCTNATPITAVPYFQYGDTSTATADYGFGANSCPGIAAATGSGTKDVVYAFTPATTGTYIVNVATFSWDAAVYVATDCSMIDATCLGAADSCTNCTETRSFTATAGTTYYIFVDGYQTSSTPANSGVFSIALNTPPPGDTCGNALPVTALPFADSGNTNGATNDYGYSTGSCPPETGGWGSGSNDIVYSFNPAVTGSYTIAVDGALDSTVYVVTNCADVDNSCVAGDEHCFSGGGCAETVTTNLTAGTTYYIVVDGYGTSSNVAGPYTIDIIKNP